MEKQKQFVLRQFFEDTDRSQKFFYLSLGTILAVLVIVIFLDIQTFAVNFNREMGFNLTRDRAYFLLSPDLTIANGRYVMFILLIFSTVFLISTLLRFSSKSSNSAMTYLESLKITGFSMVSFVFLSLFNIVAAFFGNHTISSLGLFITPFLFIAILSYGYSVITNQFITDTILEVFLMLFIALVIEIIFLSIVAFFFWCC